MANDLAKPPPAYLRELEEIENETAATRYGMKIREEKLERDQADERRNREIMRRHKAEHWTTEGLEFATSIGAGALSNVTIGQFPIGGLLNMVLGAAAKAASIYEPENLPLRVVARAGKTLLHAQVAIGTREALRGKP
ncbi:hypothetical protein ACNOYE_34790 [Nannocystaceae bacterium ST9]